MPSVWLRPRPTRDGGKRYRVEFRLGGRESKPRYGGSFRTQREALMRKAYIAGELAARRVPDLTPFAEPAPTRTVADAAREWLASRIDVADSTRTRNGLEVDRIIRLLGTTTLDLLTPARVQAFITALVEEDYKRGTIRKTVQSLAMVVDREGISPNHVRDKQVKLPRAEETELNPPTAEHVEAVYRLLPAKHRLALLWLDWSGARVGSVDALLVGDYDEQRCRVRLRKEVTKTRKGLWVELPDVLAERIEVQLGPREDRDLQARLFTDSGADALRTSIKRACKAAGVPEFSPHDLRHRRVSLLHLGGMPWARIGEFLGQRDLKTTADTYTHVLISEAEVDYAALAA